MSAPTLLALIPALPLAAVALNLLLGDRLGKRGVSLLACGAVLGSFLLAVTSVFHLASLPADVTSLRWNTVPLDVAPVGLAEQTGALLAARPRSGDMT